MVYLNTKQIGASIIFIAIVLFILFFSINSQIKKGEDLQCTMTEACPHAKNLPLQSYVGFSISILLFLIGIFMIIINKETKEEVMKKKRNIEGLLKNLNEDEKKIINMINENQGAIFQSEIAEKSGFDKVKVTRILDRLEGKGLIERRRRGMTNIIILKHE